MGAQLLKVQDNIPICASIIGQRLALASLAVGPDWVRQKVAKLGENRAMILDALAPLGEDAVKGGEGAIYLWARLPKSMRDDVAVTKWLIDKHHVSVIPGSASGGQGYIRVSYGGLDEAKCRIASTRLKKGLQDLVDNGLQS
jgi:aspartate/methionine/tyrosine aminotransferase